MALDAAALETALKARIKSELDTALDPAPDAGDTHRQLFSDALAKAISDEVVTHIIDNLEVKGVTVLVPPSTFSAGSSPSVAPVVPPTTLVQNNDGTGRVE